MEWQFAAPAAALSPYIGTYYLATSRHLTVDDLQRADTGHLHFFLQGSGYKDFPGSVRRQANLVSLSGPSFTFQSYALAGPAKLFGVCLLPRAWAGIVPCPAGSLVNIGCNAADLFGPEILDLYGGLSAAETLDDMAPMADAFFLNRWVRLPRGHVRILDGIRRWLSDDIAPDLPTLQAQFDMSDRQLARIANRYWGGPPKSLARKYAALRTASALLHAHADAHADAASEPIVHFSDQSHMIREVKRVTGQTPRQLKTQASYILKATLDPANMWELHDRG